MVMILVGLYHKQFATGENSFQCQVAFTPTAKGLMLLYPAIAVRIVVTITSPTLSVTIKVTRKRCVAIPFSFKQHLTVRHLR